MTHSANTRSEVPEGPDLRTLVAMCIAVMLVLVALPARAALPVELSADAPVLPLVPVTEVLEDERPAEAVDVVLRAEGWRALPERGALGVNSAPQWLRVQVRSARPRTMYLHVNEMGLDRATLLHLVDGEVVERRTHRRDRPLSERAVPHRAQVFPVELPAGPSTLVLRMQSVEAIQARIRLVDPARFQQEEARIHMVWTAFLGLIGGLAVYNFFLWLTLKDRAYLLNVLKAVFTHGLLQMHGGGLTYSLFPDLSPALLQGLGRIGHGLGALAAAAFAWEFLDIRRRAPISRWGYVAFSVVSVLLLGSIFLPHGLPFILAMTLLATAPVLFLGSAIESWWNGQRQAGWFLMAWVVLCAGLVVTLIQAFGLVPLVGFQGEFMLLGAAAEACLLSVALADRIRALQRDKREALQQAEASRREALEARLSAEAQKGAFLSMMSHELRTPLHHVLGLTQLLELTEADPDRRQKLTWVQDGGRRLLRMIDDMLLFAALREGRAEPRPEACVLTEAFAETLATTRSAADEAGIAFEHDLEALPALSIDAHLLDRAVAPLLDNAVRFTEEGSVRLRGTRLDGSLELVVEDTGPGIDAGRLEEVFALFEQQDAGMQRGTSGIGLGLTMSRALAEALGGRLILETGEAGGTVARLIVPVVWHAAGGALREAEAG